MAESAPEQKLGTPQKHLLTCDKHNGLIDIFCEDCDEFICTDCAKTDHKTHNWVTIIKAASQRRRQLFGFIQTIKEEKVPKIDGNIENASTKMKEIEGQADHEIQILRKHFDKIIARLTEIKTQYESNLRDNLKQRNEQVNRSKSQQEEQKNNLVAIMKLMEENNSTMSDYKLINHYREMSRLVSAVDDDTEICEFSLRYTHREIGDDEVDSLMGQTIALEDFNVTETSSFQYSDHPVSIVNAFNDNQSFIKHSGSEYVDQVNKQGDKKHKYDVTADDVCVTDTGDVYFTDYQNRTIGRLSPSGSVSTAFSTHPLVPKGICRSVDGGLLVTLRDSESDGFALGSYSRRLVRHVSFTGDVIREYEYQDDGQTRLFTLPVRVQQNGNSDICVVNMTSNTTGNLVMLSSSGRLRFVYHGQNLSEDFCPYDVACDSHGNILVTDLNNHRIHVLSPDGEFLKFLQTENEVNDPTALCIYGSTLWVGNSEGIVKLFQIKY